MIPCCGGAEDTRACLAALAEQRAVAPFEIVVVDNGSTDQTAAVADRAGARVVRLTENRGFAGGVNAGLRAARGRIVVVLNNDTMPAPHMLRHLLDALDAHPDIAAVGPTSNAVKGPARLAIGDRGATAAGRIDIERELAGVPALQDVPTLSGLCIAMRRDRWRSAAGFDERFGAGNFEDDDLCLRLRIEGWRLVIARRAFVHHLGHRSFAALGLDYREQLDRRRRQFDAKWADHPAGRAWSAWIDGDLVRAARAARDARTLSPTWVDLARLEAIAAANEGRAAEAVERLTGYLERCPLDTPAVADLTVLLVRTGQAERAQRWLLWATEHCWFEPSTVVGLLTRLAHAALESDDAQRALAFADDGLAVDPQHADLLNLRGAALLRTNRASLAREAFDRAARAGSADAACNIGVAAWESGDRNGALRCWSEILARDPHHAMARAHLERVAAALEASGAAGPIRSDS